MRVGIRSVHGARGARGGPRWFVAVACLAAVAAFATLTRTPAVAAGSPTATSLFSSLNPSERGDAVTFTARVTDAAGGAATGKVSFYDGATLLADGVPIAAGKASFTTASLKKGSHTMKAAYAGNDVADPSSGTLVQEVLAPPPTPTPTVKPTKKPTPTPTKKPTPTPTKKPTPTPTKKPTPSPTRPATPRATATPTPHPTSTPTPHPAATPTARPARTPTTTPRPTPRARSNPTPTPHPSATPSPSSSASSDPTAAASATGGGSASPTASTVPTTAPPALATAASAPSAGPSTPAQPASSAAAPSTPPGAGAPSPSAGAGAGAGASSPTGGTGGLIAGGLPAGSPAPPGASGAEPPGGQSLGHRGRDISLSGPGSIPASLLRPSEIATDPKLVAESFLFAGLLVFLLAFPAQLFNGTLEEHYDEIVGRLGLARRRGGEPTRLGRWARRFWDSPAGLAAFFVVSAALAGFLDPHFGFDAASAPMFAGILVGFIVVGLAYEYPMRHLHHRGTQDPGRMRVLPGSLIVGAACVLVSRYTNFVPGYLYGLIFSFAFVIPLTGRDAGRHSAMAFAVLAVVSTVAWVVFSAMRGAGPPQPGADLLIQTALATIVVAGVEGLMFGLMPLRTLPGEKVFEWRREVWLVLVVAAMFVFLHILIGPESGYLADTEHTPLGTAVVLFVVFGVISVSFWGYFRFRHQPEHTAAA